jgi:hypothetical protein
VRVAGWAKGGDDRIRELGLVDGAGRLEVGEASVLGLEGEELEPEVRDRLPEIEPRDGDGSDRGREGAVVVEFGGERRVDGSNWRV